jgi:translation initiation factor 1 (eIF-1/SUI1)
MIAIPLDAGITCRAYSIPHGTREALQVELEKENELHKANVIKLKQEEEKVKTDIATRLTESCPPRGRCTDEFVQLWGAQLKRIKAQLREEGARHSCARTAIMSGITLATGKKRSAAR